MPSFADSIFLFILALLLFGPKKLPVLARELGKWVGEFRRASNEFKMQMEDELRATEQADRQKQIAAMEAAAPLPPSLEEPEHPHLPRTASTEIPENSIAPPSMIRADAMNAAGEAEPPTPVLDDSAAASPTPSAESIDGVRPIPIATSGDLHMMPPATGLPTPRPRNTTPSNANDANPLGGLLDSIPEQAPATEPTFADTATENAAHGH